ncbi:hypothetical protein SKAU_G00257040 [Synaphobranchus kaupii]|uniref:Uncharacterized protein n=1 Tax=Synaphobranchus kaupii TaxID=118154 RepID=A0A9Q1F437_SYNKA|nr:hypothetical protein SKAU_G00257040 [Synaphobranchus kaupii]
MYRTWANSALWRDGLLLIYDKDDQDVLVLPCHQISPSSTGDCNQSPGFHSSRDPAGRPRPDTPASQRLTQALDAAPPLARPK